MSMMTDKWLMDDLNEQLVEVNKDLELAFCPLTADKYPQDEVKALLALRKEIEQEIKNILGM